MMINPQNSWIILVKGPSWFSLYGSNLGGPLNKIKAYVLKKHSRLGKNSHIK